MWKVFTKMINPFLYKARVANTGVTSVKTLFSNNGSHRGSEHKATKPPNVLLYTPGRSVEVTEKTVKLLETCLVDDHYVVYSISTKRLHSEPWMDNVCGLIVWPSDSVLSDDPFVHHTKAKIKEFVDSNGKLLSFSHQLLDHFEVNKFRGHADESSEIFSTSNFTESKFPRCTWRNPSKCLTLKHATFDVLLEVELDDERHAVAASHHVKNSGKEVMCSVSFYFFIIFQTVYTKRRL